MKYFLIIIYIFLVCACSVTYAFSQKPIEVPEQVTPKEEPPKKKDVGQNSSIDTIKDLAANSKCASYNWKDRGRAPKAYMRGMALTFAKAVCRNDNSFNNLVSQARRLPESKYDSTDVLSWYNSNFKALGLNNDKAGIDTLRNVYTLLIGLGMRESSGKYCCGRDMSANFSTAETAEAGLFQSSWGARRVSPEMVGLFDKYQGSRAGCFFDVFSEGVSCSASNAKNWGTGKGMEFQALSKSCPAFSVEYASLLVRYSGGTKGEYGPLRKKAAEIRPECSDMLKSIQSIIASEPEICGELF